MQFPCNDLPLAQPFSPAGQATRLYRATGDAASERLSSCLHAPASSAYAGTIYSSGAMGPIGVPRPNNYGGLNTGMEDLGAYYDPRSRTQRAPVLPTGAAAGTDTGADTLNAPMPLVGTGAFVPGTDAEWDAATRPRTQMAPHGPVAVEPVPLRAYHGPCVCVCAPAHSLSEVALSPANGVAVRDALVAAGLFTMDAELAAAPLMCAAAAARGRREFASCACRLMGGPDLYLAFAQYVTEGGNDAVAAVKLPSVPQALAVLDQAYVSLVSADALSSVVAKAKMNYARAEGARAFLDPRPLNGFQVDALPQYDGTLTRALPVVLPGTGSVILAGDNAMVARTLTDPRARPQYRAAMSAVTGLPIGAAPARAPVVRAATATVAVSADVVRGARGGPGAGAGAGGDQTLDSQVRAAQAALRMAAHNPAPAVVAFQL
jgi:hypothetical protein